MSDYEPKVGDRVRVVLEGDVGLGVDGETPYLRTGYFSLAVRGVLSDALSIEKIAPPLPTTPGSVVKYQAAAGTRFRLLHEDGKWWSEFAEVFPEELVRFSGLEVIFDAGASS